MKKDELLNRVRAGRADWEKTVRSVDPAQTDVPGVVGEWAVKDIVGHLAAWEGYMVLQLQGAVNGTKAEAPNWPPNLDETGINEWVYQKNQSRPAADLLAEEARTYEQLLSLAEATPEQLLTTTSLGELVAGNTFEHYQEHAQSIERWLAARQ